MKKILILITAFFAFVGVSAQDYSALLSDWKNYVCPEWVCNVCHDDTYLYCSCQNGFVRIDKNTGEKTVYDRANSNIADNRLLGVYKHGDDIFATGRTFGISTFKDGSFSDYYPEFTQNMKWITSMAFSNDGSTYIGALKYLYELTPQGKLKQYTTSKQIISSFWSILSIAVENDNLIWVGGMDAFKQMMFCKFTHEKGLETVSTDYGSVYAINIDKNNVKWLGTDAGLVKYDGTNFTLYSSQNSNLPSGNISGIKNTSDNKQLILTSRYLSVFDGQTFVNHPYSVSGDWLTSLDVDGDNIYVGTRHNGLMRYQDGKFTAMYQCETGSSTNTISFSSCSDDKGNVYVGTANELLKYDQNNEWHRMCHQKDYSSSLFRVSVTQTDHEGNLWVKLNRSDTCLLKISDTDTIAFTTKDIKYGLDINLLAFDSKDNLWAATTGSGLYKYDGKTWQHYDTSNSGLKANEIQSLAIDHDIVWCGAMDSNNSSNGGLFKIDGKDWTWYNKSNSPMPSNLVTAIAPDKNVLWLVCRDEVNRLLSSINFGLTKFDGTNWQTYNVDNSNLGTNVILDLAIDPNGRLWLGTYGFSPKTNDYVGLTLKTGDDFVTFNTKTTRMSYNDVNKITFDKYRGWIWLSHLDSYGISSAKVADIVTQITMPEYHSGDATVDRYYSIDGMERQQPTKGLNIVRTKDGTGRKVYIQ